VETFLDSTAPPKPSRASLVLYAHNSPGKPMRLRAQKKIEQGHRVDQSRRNQRMSADVKGDARFPINRH